VDVNRLTRIEVVEVPDRFYMKVSAAARYLGLCPNTLRKYTDLGLIQARMLPSGDRLYAKEWLDAFVQELPDARSGGGGDRDAPGPIIGSVRPVLESGKEDGHGN